MYASIRYGPKVKGLFVRSTDHKPFFQEMPPAWYEDSWVISRGMGETHSKPHHMTREGAGWGGQPHYDVRVVSEEDATEITRIDQAILDLQRQKRTLLDNRFRTWQIAKREDCEQVIPGQTPKEAAAKAKAARPVGPRDVSSERRMVHRLSQALSEKGG